MEQKQESGITIGCTGSLLLTPEQVQWVRRGLQKEILPVLLDRWNSSRLRFAMGLAPGADLVFADAVHDWCLTRKLAHGICAWLPVPPEVILADWNEKAGAAGWPDGESQTRCHWQQMCRVLERSSTAVRLWPPDTDAVQLATRSFRQAQYRKLGARLVQRSHALIAICDPANGGDAGGAVELLQWRRNPEGISAALAEPDAVESAGPLALLNLRTEKVEWERPVH
jgi:hypothetical protein